MVILLASVLVACELPAMEFEYSNEGGEISITGYLGPGGQVVIPSTIDGFPVTRIGDRAFRDRNELSGIDIPESVVAIGEEAFTHCHGIRSVDLPRNVAEIDGSAFSRCRRLVEFRRPR